MAEGLIGIIVVAAILLIITKMAKSLRKDVSYGLWVYEVSNGKLRSAKTLTVTGQQIMLKETDEEIVLELSKMSVIPRLHLDKETIHIISQQPIRMIWVGKSVNLAEIPHLTRHRGLPNIYGAYNFDPDRAFKTVKAEVQEK